MAQSCNEITTVTMVVQAGTYNNVTVEVYDMGNTLVPGMQQIVSAGQTQPLAFNFPSSQAAYKVRVTGINTPNVNITPGWTNTSNWQTTGTGSLTYNNPNMEITANAMNDGADIVYTAPANGQNINLTATLQTGNNPVTVELFDNNNNLLQSAVFTTPNSSNNINFTVNNNTAGAHRLSLRGSPVMQPNPVTIYTDDFNNTWATSGSANATHNINTSVAVTVNNNNDGIQRTVTTPGNGNPLDFDLLLNTGANPVIVELYDPANNNILLPPVSVPQGNTNAPVNFYLSSGTLGNYGIRTRGNPTPQNNQIVTNGETSLAWAGINSGSTTYNAPNLEITTSGATDGASANFTTTMGGTVTGSLQVQAVANDVMVEVYDNSSNLVAGPYTVTFGNTSTVNFSFTAAATQHQIRITNTTNPGSYGDMIYVTAFNVWENILVPDNYTITQLTVKETQYIAVPDVFNVSNLSVTATPYPDVAHVHQLYVSYAKPYTRPLCANNNDKLEGVNKYRFGFNGKERDDETYGNGNEYDYGFRIYNPRIGKFLSVDPLLKGYPYYTPYHFAGNKPICSIDLDGLEDIYYMNSFVSKKGDAVIELMNKTTLGAQFLQEFQNPQTNIGYDLFVISTPLPSHLRGTTNTLYGPETKLFDSETRQTVNAFDAIKQARENKKNGIENKGEIYESLVNNLTEEILFSDELGETLEKCRTIILVDINTKVTENNNSSNEIQSKQGVVETAKVVGHEIKAHANRMATGRKATPDQDHLDYQGTEAEGLGNFPGSLGDTYEKQVDEAAKNE